MTASEREPRESGADDAALVGTSDEVAALAAWDAQQRDARAPGRMAKDHPSPGPSPIPVPSPVPTAPASAWSSARPSSSGATG